MISWDSSQAINRRERVHEGKAWGTVTRLAGQATYGYDCSRHRAHTSLIVAVNKPNRTEPNQMARPPCFCVKKYIYHGPRYPPPLIRNKTSERMQRRGGVGVPKHYTGGTKIGCLHGRHTTERRRQRRRRWQQGGREGRGDVEQKTKDALTTRREGPTPIL